MKYYVSVSQLVELFKHLFILRHISWTNQSTVFWPVTPCPALIGGRAARDHTRHTCFRL